MRDHFGGSGFMEEVGQQFVKRAAADFIKALDEGTLPDDDKARLHAALMKEVVRKIEQRDLSQDFWTKVNALADKIVDEMYTDADLKRLVEEKVQAKLHEAINRSAEYRATQRVRKSQTAKRGG